MNDLSQRPALAEAASPRPKRVRQFIGESDQAFVLHTYAYRETSLIVETFTRLHGRVVMVAKGAKRPQGALRGLLNPFQGLALTWFGRSEMKTLKSAEQEKILPQLSGAALLSAFYLNELLLKLATREDPHESLFDAYAETMSSLAMLPVENRSAREIAPILRQFEVTLLQELGYALQLREETDSHAGSSRARILLCCRARADVGGLRCTSTRNRSRLTASGQNAHRHGVWQLSRSANTITIEAIDAHDDQSLARR